jgi:hypothetical protein
VSGPAAAELTKGERYLIERADGTTHEVGVVGRNKLDGIMCQHIVEADGLLMMGF